MGKVKRGRQKFHTPAVKEKKPTSSDKVEVVDMMDTEGKDSSINMFSSLSDPNTNIFKVRLFNRFVHNFDILELGGIEAAKKEAQERKKKQQTPVVGDIGLLGEALPTLDLLLKGSTGPESRDIQQKTRSIPKEKNRKKQMLQDIALFQQVFKHPTYQENPTGTISEHLHNKLKQDEEMDT
ncbi:hypothetical protein KUTeg_002656 [Tegillarca granosa]|uniref:Uncharacterized protein n=1 Tax=Tegillarca granosa TaxID=220873 RepID=A0ABQ9FUZ1_TEGGR|nr:hypothetical protein KUTeg_002656 [Tegillarca granosa]